MDEIGKVRAEIKALEEELAQTDQTIVRLKKELDVAEKRRNVLRPVYMREAGTIYNMQRKLAQLEAEDERARIWATAPVVRFDGRPDGRLVKLTPKQIHVMTTRDGSKTVYDRVTGRTRWNIDGQITNLEELTR